MAKTNGNNYFEMMLDLIGYSVRASEALQKALKEFSQENLEASLPHLHQIEHSADEQAHVVRKKLAKEFITPIEREDILHLVSLIDDITDAIEDVIIKVDMFCVKDIRPEALLFCDIIDRCCQGLSVVFKEFHNFKRSKDLQAAIIEVNRLEEEGDRLYRDAMRGLYASGNDAINVIAWSELFGQLEKCCDLCEEAADSVDEVVMKNA